MAFRVTGIKVNIDRDKGDLTAKIARKIGIPPQEIRSYKVVKKAVDARDKSSGQIYFVYTVEAELTPKGDRILARRKFAGVTLCEPDQGLQIVPGNFSLPNRPVIVGAGPAGTFAALTLARAGYRPIVFERGQDVETRARDIDDFWLKRLLHPESNVQFGEGGAGTFSDGKLTTRVNDPRAGMVLEEFVKAGAPKEILFLHKPHIGTDKLRTVVVNLRRLLQELGGEIFFNSKVTGLLVEADRVTGVVVNGETEIPAQVVVMAIGHSARDTYEMLAELPCKMEQKAFAVGVRVEHPQDLIDNAQYGQNAGHPKLGAADYQLVFNNKEMNRAAYTFCMCPGGQVVAAASELNTVVTNGMSNYARDTGVANSAVVVSVKPEDFAGVHPLSGVEFQRKLEQAAFHAGGRNYNAPAQLVGDYLAGRGSTDLAGASWATYRPGLEPADLHECLPGYVNTMLEEAIGAFDRKLKGFAQPTAVLTGVETRTSAPVRLIRDDDQESAGLTGMYPAGEGAGYAGGIMSAAIDGIRVAEAIISRYRRGE